jgi:hypothetical protein
MFDETAERYDLLVLEVGLAVRGSDALVRWILRSSATGALLLPEEYVPPAEMGIPDRIDRRQALYQGYDFHIPESLSGPLSHRLAVEPPDRPLWLSLVKPYGYLGMVPWERLLQPRLGRSILRLPEYVSRPPRETSSALDVVLCGSGPISKEFFSIAGHLVEMVDRIQQAVPRRTTIHVFVDRSVYEQLPVSWQDRAGPVRLYPPKEAERYVVPDSDSRVTDPGGRLESPWLLWMRDALGKRSVDVVHFLCHGYLSRDRGALAFAQSPLKNEDQSMARFVGAPELTTFLTQVGAWSTGFTSPENNYSEMGLRLLADNLAQSRPGPVLHHEVTRDPEFIALAAAYRFLYSRSPEPPPRSPALLLYCQPSYVAPEQPLTRGLPTKAAFEAPMTEAVFAAEENVPSWVAATERYVEQYEFRRSEKTAPAPAGRRTRGFGAVKEATAPPDPVQDTLRQIQEIVARAAANRTTGGGE